MYVRDCILYRLHLFCCFQHDKASLIVGNQLVYGRVVDVFVFQVMFLSMHVQSGMLGKDHDACLGP